VSDDDQPVAGSAAGGPAAASSIPEPHIPGLRRPLPQRSRGKARGFSGRSVALFAIVTILGVAVFLKDRLDNGPSDATKTLTSLDVGDCIAAAEGEELADVQVVSCDSTHRVEVYAVGTATKAIGDDPSNDAEIMRICRDDVTASADAGVQQAIANGASLGFLVDGTRKGRLACTINTEPRTGSYIADAATLS
jgi:hypothetical protein